MNLQLAMPFINIQILKLKLCNILWSIWYQLATIKKIMQQANEQHIQIDPFRLDADSYYSDITDYIAGDIKKRFSILTWRLNTCIFLKRNGKAI